VLGPSAMRRLGAYAGLSTGALALPAPAIGKAKRKLSAATANHE